MNARGRDDAQETVRLLLALEFVIWNDIAATALRSAAGIEVVGAVTPERLARGGAPAIADVALVSLPVSPARWSLFRRLRDKLRPARLLVVGGGDPVYASRLLRAGARGYLYGDGNLSLLVKAIRHVARGELWADHRLAASALEPGLGGEGEAAWLTDREARVLAAVAEGKRNKEIAVELAITEATVKTHLNRVYRKLGVSDRLQAGLAAAGYVDEPLKRRRPNFAPAASP